MKATLPITLLTLATAGSARADQARCVETSSDLAFTVSDLPELTADTGWIPSGSPMQIRVAGRLAGTTTVAMSLAPTACWAQDMTITTTGLPQTGLLDSAYGAELQVKGKI